ncbi:myeloid leukemia factor isoform X2 [Danaus plexippus]|uniref:Myeloid leukemia factor like protein n=1 Tax=Danaus plexippus plexippus TaxID=278856 RepID=A0A212FER3_DANPL|nr:myeloid leukemia factor isoform X2 [Danaus plexippus]OWR52203.1 myeloid leukemia factor like protein [Danaus plexippus plexippus]
MSLFGALMADVEDDPFFGSHMRHMRQMNNMMNSLFSDPFGMLGEGPLAIMGARRGNALMPFMPQMPSLNRLFTDLSDGHMSSGSSFSSSTVVMSSGLNGNPQVFSSTSSTKIGPNGVKETRKTLQDSRTGVKKMSIGHHIGQRAHVVEREQNVYSGDAEERQEFINLEEDEAEEFDREFQERAGMMRNRNHRALTQAPHGHTQPRLALPPAPSHTHPHANRRPHARRPLRAGASPLALPSSSVREVYSGSHPRRHKHHRHRHETDN